MLVKKINKRLRYLLVSLLILFVMINGIAFMHAYKLTHFGDGATEASVTDVSFLKKADLLLTGVDNPRPRNQQLPDTTFETITIKSNKLLDGWIINRNGAEGTVILFHGYREEKSSMLDKAAAFRKMGFNTMLVDFRGSGKSEGNQTTIGFKEAEEVKDCLEYAIAQGQKNIHLFGTSMGAVAIMKAINDYQLQPSSIIIECPFGTMVKTVKARFRNMGVPAFPMAHLLVFWGGVQNGYWAFGHNPEEYAKGIKVPTLLLYGEKDIKVSRQEIDVIYTNLQGRKLLRTYPNAGHESYLNDYKEEWINDIATFIK